MNFFHYRKKELFMAFLLSLTFSAISFGQAPPKGQIPWVDELVMSNDTAVEKLLEIQQQDPTSEFYGGYPNRDSIYNTASAASFMHRFSVAFSAPASKYFHSDLMIERMNLAMDFMLAHQHEDGTIDLLTTNFHSTPDVAFLTKPLTLVYRVLELDGDRGSQEVRAKLKKMLLNIGEALSVGGIHTPNHRWVTCMALSRLNQIFPNQKYLDRIDQWMAEGMDMDSDGQWTERSTSVYSPHQASWFYTMADMLGREDLRDYTRRNLEMTMYYFHPNGEIATEASRRQDQYNAIVPYSYYLPYREMAIHDDNGQFGALAKSIEDKLTPASLSGNLIYYFTDPKLMQDYPIAGLPTNYAKHFKDSELVRIRREHYDATILGKNNALFTFQNKDAVLQTARMATAFFGKGQFIADTLIVHDGGYTMTQELEGPYYQPIARELIAPSGRWEDMGQKLRPQSEIQKIKYVLNVKEISNGFELEFSAEGTDHVPVAIELSFREGGTFEGVEALETVDGAYFLKGTSGSYTQNGDRIDFSGGLYEHRWTQLRGALDKIKGNSVYLTGYTPFKHTVTITAGE